MNNSEQLEATEFWEDSIDEIVAAFERQHRRKLLYSISFYWRRHMYGVADFRSNTTSIHSNPMEEDQYLRVNLILISCLFIVGVCCYTANELICLFCTYLVNLDQIRKKTINKKIMTAFCAEHWLCVHTHMWWDLQKYEFHCEYASHKINVPN